ncbi:MAG: VIT1/CCC1 family protein [Pygmaiobacter sp.]|jgi:VIT1/CCC1 family predicted Fe2+/Mn2+ transporter|nr:VIT1/CCC1 family protein [Pygmaiobacter sp.]
METPKGKESLTAEALALLRRAQVAELTEQQIYLQLASILEKKQPQNADVLRRLAEEEGRHAAIWQSYTGYAAKPHRPTILHYLFLARVLGFTFALKKMEHGELLAQTAYGRFANVLPEANEILADEKRHEAELLGLLDEERLHYVGSMVLGLNDALVELTGTLAGLTFAMRDNRLIALSGLITGASATLSMASSEYLSARSEGRPDALRSSAYTGITYLITVVLLVLPYLLLPAGAYALSLAIMLVVVVLAIAAFNYYISVAQDLSFRHRFGEMAAISLGVAVLSFGIGLLVKQFLGIDL